MHIFSPCLGRQRQLYPCELEASPGQLVLCREALSQKNEKHQVGTGKVAQRVRVLAFKFNKINYLTLFANIEWSLSTFVSYSLILHSCLEGSQDAVDTDPSSQYHLPLIIQAYCHMCCKFLLILILLRVLYECLRCGMWLSMCQNMLSGYGVTDPIKEEMEENVRQIGEL